MSSTDTVSAAPRRAQARSQVLLGDTLTPLAAYQRLAGLSPYRFLFESITGGEQVSRYSILGAEPSEVLILRPDGLDVMSPDGEVRATFEEPLQALRQRIDSVDTDISNPELMHLPFHGGWVGFFGWDLIRLLERLPNRPPDRYGLPIAVLARYDSAVVFDHARQRIVVLSNEIDHEVDATTAQARLEEIVGRLRDPAPTSAVALPAGTLEPASVLPPSLSADEYRDAVRHAKEYIAAGDIFQVVPARRWEIESAVDPHGLYRALRTVNPSPYMVLLETPDVSLVGGSPEMQVRAHGDRFQMRPIAGTRPRGATVAEDARLAAEMIADPKEVAEHVMLVDLARNDLGRVASPGGVSVPAFLEIEYYSHVMHIVSSVEAKRGEGRKALDALFATFPAGTLSGAPKIRAMEIIDELEPEARGPYGGAIGYISYNGDMDTCITIRTLVVQPERTTVTAGAGIVADSDPDREEQETRDKAAALLQAVALAQQMEADHV